MADRPKHLFGNAPILWTIVVIDPDGEPMDSVSLPAITIRKNGVSLGEFVGVTRRDVGVYDCSYLPTVVPQEGDQFTVEEFIQVNFGQGTTSHKNAWEFIASTIESGAGIRQVACTVKDEDGALIPSALVNLQDSFGVSLGISAITSTLGVAYFNLNDGSYIFIISAYPGYLPHAGEPYTVSAAQTTPVLTLYNEVDPTPSPEIPSGIDQSGIKRVKTKHMEIEKFDPRIMQDVASREQELPSFCTSTFCIGVPKKCR